MDHRCSSFWPNVDAAKAATRPLAGAHSIWELVLHITAWDKSSNQQIERCSRARFLTKRTFQSSTTPAKPHGNRHSDVEAKPSVTQRSCGHVAEVRLDDPIVAGMSSVYNHLHGVIQHDLYHAGQIAILKKANQS